MITTKSARTTTIVVHPIIGPADGRLPEAGLMEAIGLAEAINLDVRASELIRVSRISPATLLGGGQVERLKTVIANEAIILAIVDYALSPGQQRNLEHAWNCKVIDRTGLILEIFGERARTREGQLQVELAAMTYQRSRLVRSWTHLERQRASGNGAGFLGGPGESQLELDRRLIDARIDRIKLELKDVRRTRGLQRRVRDRRGQKQVALVGYTNAGKSTLFNKLTTANVLAKDMLFATLDPTLRRLDFDGGEQAMLADTVGFIADLPTGLVEAFRATLEEVTAADLILHIRDAAHPDTQAQRQDVLTVLASLGIEEADPRLVEVLNKADLLPPEQLALLQRYNSTALPISALTGEGLSQLRQALQTRLFPSQLDYQILVPHSNGAALAWLYAHGKVAGYETLEDGEQVQVQLTLDNYSRYCAKFLPGIYG